MSQVLVKNGGNYLPILPQTRADMVGHILPLSDWASAGTYQVVPGVDDHHVHLVSGQSRTNRPHS